MSQTCRHGHSQNDADIQLICLFPREAAGQSLFLFEDLSDLSHLMSFYSRLSLLVLPHVVPMHIHGTGLLSLPLNIVLPRYTSYVHSPTCLAFSTYPHYPFSVQVQTWIRHHHLTKARPSTSGPTGRTNRPIGIVPLQQSRPQ